jgi:hypothetical protein
MVAVGLVTDCSEPAATKNAVGHGVSSLRVEDHAVPESSASGVTSRKFPNIPRPASDTGGSGPVMSHR